MTALRTLTERPTGWRAYARRQGTSSTPCSTASPATRRRRPRSPTAPGSSATTWPTRSSRSNCPRSATPPRSPTWAPARGSPGFRWRSRCPAREVSLVESNGRKCAFIAAAIEAACVTNAAAVHARAESWPDGPGGVRPRHRSGAGSAGRRGRVCGAAPGGGRVAGGVAGPARPRGRGRRRAGGRGARPGARDGDAGRALPRRPAPAPPRDAQGRADARPLSAAARAWPANARWVGRLTANGASFISHGDRLRHRQPEGRGRQDHHRRQSGRLHRGGRLRDAADRHGPAGQRDPRPGDRQAHHAHRLRRAPGWRAAGRQRSSPPRSPIWASSRRAPIWRAPTSSCRAMRDREPPARRAGADPGSIRLRPARLPAVAGPADGQRPGRRRPGDRPGAVRVLRARGPGRPARHLVAGAT